jgi:hypothetical protein
MSLLPAIDLSIKERYFVVGLSSSLACETTDLNKEVKDLLIFSPFVAYFTI